MSPAVAPLMVVFGGLPGTGKTTLARALSARLGAAYLRIDSIEQAMRRAGVPYIGAAGYAAANALAQDNLLGGTPVVADSVNPVAESRLAWRQVAASAGALLAEIEIVCSDQAEHRRRVEARRPDIPGQMQPSWQAVLDHAFEPWVGAHLILDTAGSAPGTSLQACLDYLRERGARLRG